MNQTERRYPGPVPDGETPVLENPTFVNACMSVVSGRAASIGWRLGKSILTRSDVWGFVFRIDLQSKHQVQSAEVGHRFICWRAQEDDAVMGSALIPGRNLKPL